MKCRYCGDEAEYNDYLNLYVRSSPDQQPFVCFLGGRDETNRVGESEWKCKTKEQIIFCSGPAVC